MKYLPIEDCYVGYVYRVYARNFSYGIYAGNGFIGVREKFGREFLFTEYHADSDPNFGTVRPIAPILGAKAPFVEDELTMDNERLLSYMQIVERQEHYDRGIPGILQRKRNGVDCTEDESVEVLHYFTDNAERLSDSDYADLDQVVELFPLEWDQWWSDQKYEK